ncbi:AhpD family alkylhydroperoxidase [Chitinophaga niastensis]|uniref:AhpD family alkylhydroperoxidase n=1 Tax=Chitinophaga niastensis TaxID=536980 RepID=A0A2P8HHL9_CHINA|nr:carboxymuconolactone decarboxylase family protein [Chitinophaga niastensis]PSL45716.1 AhpD family alkylhydroperoxidase [Chitinophaga niastensis]
MKKRIDFNVVQPKAYDAMDALDRYVNESSIGKLHKELIKIKASQLNGCAYCVDAHTADAQKLGESLQRIFLISAWRESGNIFTEAERLLFQITEEITLISQHGLSEATYEQAIAIFGEEKTAEIIMSVVTINSWNRIGVATQLRPLKRVQH